jgi:glycosyltransferase involved in cell wall biosynthesis
MTHISVCICTYKRPELLERLLTELGGQQTGEVFTFGIVVVDNDRGESARNLVESFAADHPALDVRYEVEPKQNIALARNRAVKSAKGDWIAFIDDDEFPIHNWLLTLFETCRDHGSDGALGPVRPHFDQPPPDWVIRGKFYERATYPTGLVIDWRKGRTGNTLLRRQVLSDFGEQPFRPEFRNGEDQEFFYRAIGRGYKFVWSNEAVAYETVPPVRWGRRFLLRRALLRGSIEPKTPHFGWRDVLRSVIAVPVYTLALPFTLIAGQEHFMALLVRLCDHLGKLLALSGINPVSEPYVTE